jgi:SET domain-containing protein
MEHYVRPDDPTPLEFIQSKKIILGKSSIEGRGVFATEDIFSGEIIERCPMIQMDYRSKYQLDPQIFNYMYAQLPCPCGDCQKHGYVIHMIGGYGMMYNHQDNCNAKWKFNYRQLLSDVIAITDIKAGNEIFINYGNAYFLDKVKKTCKKL